MQDRHATLRVSEEAARPASFWDRSANLSQLVIAVLAVVVAQVARGLFVGRLGKRRGHSRGELAQV